MNALVETQMFAYDWNRNSFRKLEKNDLARGQKLIYVGYACSTSQAWLEHIDKNGEDWIYHYISRECKNDDVVEYHRGSTHEIPPYSKKFGIGIYFDDQNPEVISENQLLDMIRQYEEQASREQAAMIKAEEERRSAIERGKKLFEKAAKESGFTPEYAITAELRQDESDIQSDYFASRTVRTIILAISKHKRDLFSEMRKAAATAENPDIRALANAPEDYEHREKYSMGAGYYLGESSYSGWIIRKSSVSSHLEEAAGRDGGFGIMFKNETNKKSTATAKQTDGTVIDNIQLNRIQVVFTSVPSLEIRTCLKQSGFFWSKKHRAWHAGRKEANRLKAIEILQNQ